MPYALEPLVAGELGDRTELDTSTHPPTALAVEYVLDLPTEEDLIQSFPVFLVSEELARALANARLRGFDFADAAVLRSDNYVALFEDVPHKSYRWLKPDEANVADCWVDAHHGHLLCVSDAMYAIIAEHRIEGCQVGEIAGA